MVDFVRYWIPLAVLVFAVLMLLGAMLGDGAYLAGAILAAAAFAAIGICIYKKLQVIEEKLDRLLEKTESVDQ